MKKIFSVFAVLPMALLGCNQNTTTQTTTNTPEVVDGNAPYVSPLPSDAPVVKVATTPTAPPFSYQDEYGNMVGIDIDTIRAIGEEEGFKVEFYPDTFANMFTAVETGTRDLAISAISYNADRASKYALSNSYFINPSAIMYKEGGTQVASLANLAGKRVGVMPNSKQSQHIASTPYAELVTRPSTFLLFEALVQDKADAILGDEPLLRYTASRYPQHKTTIVAYENPNEPAAQQVILLAKSNQELLGKVNAGIEKINTNGKMQTITDKYLGPSRGSN